MVPIWLLQATSVPHQKYVVYFGEQSASPARRLDEEIPGVFRGEATQQAAGRAVEIGKVFLVRDTSPDYVQSFG